MERTEYLIDTNAVIDYLGKKLPVSGMAFMNHVMDTLPIVSVITKIEVLGFKAPGSYDQLLTNFMQDVIVLNLTDEIVAVSINIRKTIKPSFLILLLLLQRWFMVLLCLLSTPLILKIY
ncbi:MAG: hypothetical protein BGO68_01075 [Candidatus Amoebophilus sp. 36-38]|nr:MAG: hypothetical protein BGO68_01075 [Candidatus Amoebophilus sp. 36-38]